MDNNLKEELSHKYGTDFADFVIEFTDHIKNGDKTFVMGDKSYTMAAQPAGGYALIMMRIDNDEVTGYNHGYDKIGIANDKGEVFIYSNAFWSELRLKSPKAKVDDTYFDRIPDEMAKYFPGTLYTGSTIQEKTAELKAAIRKELDALPYDASLTNEKAAQSLARTFFLEGKKVEDLDFKKDVDTEDIHSKLMVEADYKDIFLNPRSVEKGANEYVEANKDHYMERKATVARAAEIMADLKPTRLSELYRTLKGLDAKNVSIDCCTERGHEYSAKCNKNILAWTVRDSFINNKKYAISDIQKYAISDIRDNRVNPELISRISFRGRDVYNNPKALEMAKDIRRSISSTDPKELEELSKSEYMIVRQYTAENTNTPGVMLDKLAMEFPSVVASNKNAPEEALSTAILHGGGPDGYDIKTLIRVAGNPNATPTHMAEILDFADKGIESKDEYGVDGFISIILQNIAANEASAPEILERVAGMTDYAILEEYQKTRFLNSLCANASTPATVLEDMLDKAQKSQDLGEDERSSRCIIKGIARNPAISESLAESLLKMVDNMPELGLDLELAENPGVSTEILEQIVSARAVNWSDPKQWSASDDVLKAVIANPNADLTILKQARDIPQLSSWHWYGYLNNKISDMEDPGILISNLKQADPEKLSAPDAFMSLAVAENKLIEQGMTETAQKIHDTLSFAGVSLDSGALMVEYPDGQKKVFDNDYAYGDNLLAIAKSAIPMIEDVYKREKDKAKETPKEKIQEKETEKETNRQPEPEQQYQYNDWGMDR